jgi:hypothetical protein
MVRVAALTMSRDSLQITRRECCASEAIYAYAVLGYDCKSSEIQTYGGAVHATFDTQFLNVVPPQEGTVGAEYREQHSFGIAKDPLGILRLFYCQKIIL